MNKNSGSGSYSYRSAYNHEDDDKGIPVVNCTSRRVELLVYPIDTTSGSGCSILSGITGRDIKHTTIVAFGVEYEFCQTGVETKIRSRNQIPFPDDEIYLGCTEKSASELRTHVDELRRTKYKSSTYNMYSNNCHNFCNDLCLFLTGNQIPNKFREMADEVVSQTTKMALITGGVITAGVVAYNLIPAREELPQAQGPREPERRQAQQNNNSLLLGLGAVAAGGLAYHMLSSNEEPQREPQRQLRQRAASQDESGFGGTGLLGALAAGAAGLAYALDSSNQQPQQRALGFGARNDNADENGLADWLDRMLK